MDHPAQLHVGFQALHHFVAENKGLPRSYNEVTKIFNLSFKVVIQEDASKLLSYAHEINKKSQYNIELNDKLIKKLSYLARGDLSPMIAFIGGLTAQEVLKACSGKFHPIKQYLLFDSIECLPTNTVTETDAKPVCLLLFELPTDFRLDRGMMVKLQYLGNNSMIRLPI